MRNLILLTFTVFLSGCMGLNTIQKLAEPARNTRLEQVPKIYLTMGQMDQMSREELREYSDM